MIKLIQTYLVDSNFNCFYQVVLDKDDIYFYNRKRIKRRGVKDNFYTAKSIIEKNKVIEKEVVIENSEIAHNFSTFKYRNSFFAIGGKESWNSNGSFNQGVPFEQGIQEAKNFYSDYDPSLFDYIDEKLYKKMLKKFPTEHNSHNQGLYLLKEDNNKWYIVSDLPIITRNTSNIYKPFTWRLGNFDGQQSMLYNPYTNKFYCYTRVNFDWGMRGIQVGVSENLTNWNKAQFHFPYLNGKFKRKVDEFYTCNFFMYKEWIIGILPYANKKENTESIRFYISKDGINFTLFYKILERKRSWDRFNDTHKNYHIPVQGYYVNDKGFHFFIHNNYFGHNKGDVTISHYTIPLNEFEKALND